jgi:hypothetical protein
VKAERKDYRRVGREVSQVGGAPPEEPPGFRARRAFFEDCARFRPAQRRTREIGTLRRETVCEEVSERGINDRFETLIVV